MKKWIALVLALCLICQTGLAAVNEKVLSRAVEIIGQQESGHNYGCVTVDTNGKISAGFMQWNGNRAVNLVKKAIELGQKEYPFDGSLTSADKEWVKELLLSAEGRKAQDEQARTDVTAYLKKAVSLGIKDLNALCYYCDIVHQVGTGAITKYHKLAAEKAGSYEEITLDHLYQAALNYATHTKSRRTRVYNLLKDDPIRAETPPAAPGKLIIVGSASMKKGQKQQLSAALSTGENVAVRWKSANPRIAKVNAKGVVKALKKGRAVIKCKTADGQIASFVLKVTKK